MNFLEEFNSEFGDKYAFLTLKNAVVKKSEGLLVVTFLYSSQEKELSPEQKREITEFFSKKLPFEKLSIKVKFLRVYLEEKLVLKAILNYFEQKYKLVMTYLKPENIEISINPIDVKVGFTLSKRMCDFFAEHKIQNDLSKFLKDNFLSEFSIDVVEDAQILDEVDLENVEIKSAPKLTQRYLVNIEKEVVGKNILNRPEFLSFINAPKNSVVVGGFIKKIERRDFIIKKGKREGQQKAYFSFTIQDEKGKLDCIYFCPKRYEKDLEALEDMMFVLLHGDVRNNQMGKLCLYVDKIALASPVIDEKPEKQNFLGHVVKTEKLDSMEQDSMFGSKNRYNNKIMGKTIVVFDIETTGLDPNTDQIIELGAVKIENGNIIEKFSSFAKPRKKIPLEVQKLTGITEDMVENAPDVENVIKDFYDFTRDCVISGHNVIGFDIKFVRREGDALGLSFDNDIIDTYNEVRTAKLKLTKFNLGAVTKALGINLEGAHRAWNDAYATAQVLLRLNQI